MIVFLGRREVKKVLPVATGTDRTLERAVPDQTRLIGHAATPLPDRAARLAGALAPRNHITLILRTNTEVPVGVVSVTPSSCGS